MTLWQALGGFLQALGKLFGTLDAAPTPAPPAPPTPPWTPPATPQPDATITELFAEHNSFRRNNGAQPLALSEPLNRAAQRHADWMAVNRNMSHSEAPNTPGYDAQSFSERIKREGYVLATGGENIAAGQRTVQEVMDAWMHSSGHRANIINDAYWHAGFGVARDSYGHIYWCAVFATPMTRSLLKRAVVARVRVVVNLPRALVS